MIASHIAIDEVEDLVLILLDKDPVCLSFPIETFSDDFFISYLTNFLQGMSPFIYGPISSVSLHFPQVNPYNTGLTEGRGWW